MLYTLSHEAAHYIAENDFDAFNKVTHGKLFTRSSVEAAAAVGSLTLLPARRRETSNLAFETKKQGHQTVSLFFGGDGEI